MKEDLKTTPLYSEHLALGAKIVPFAGYFMPIQYTSIVEEHLAVRNQAGLFDVSHMGEIEIEGEDALKFLERICVSSISKLKENEVKYTVMLYPDAGIVDDFFVYKISSKKFLLVVNASNYEKDLKHLIEQNKENVTIKGSTDKFTEVALQGPQAEKILAPLVDFSLEDLQYFFFKEAKIKGKNCLISRTGYTGEDGFEIYFSPEDASFLWRLLLEEGKPYGLKPAGLGARDTLRFEVCYWLYGNDITCEINPLESGQSFMIDWEKDFFGKEELLKVKENGVKRKWMGLKMIDSGIPRHNYEIFSKDLKIGFVTSGSYAPYLNGNYALAYIDKDYAVLDSVLEISIRGEKRKAQIIKKPFLKPRTKKRIE